MSRDPEHIGNPRFILTGDMIAGIKIENGSCDPDHAPFRDDLSTSGQHLRSAYVPNLKSLSRS